MVSTGSVLDEVNRYWYRMCYVICDAAGGVGGGGG